MTIEVNQDAAALHAQLDALEAELARRTEERDRARREMDAAVQAAVEARALALAAARALGLPDERVEELPQEVASLRWDHDETILQYDLAQKRAYEAETKLEVLRESARVVVLACQNWQDGLMNAEGELLLQIERLEEAATEG